MHTAPPPFYGFMFTFVLYMLIIGYAKFLKEQLRDLSSGPAWMDAYKELVKCVNIHLRLKKMMDDMKAIWGVPLGLMLKMAEIVIGACIFVITGGEEKLKINKDLFIFIGYKLVCFFNHFIPCCIGSEIFEITNGYNYDLFSSDWVDGNPRYRKAVFIFGEIVKQPIKLSVLFYDKLDMETCKTNMNSAYSLFSIFVNLKKTNIIEDLA